MNIYSEAFVEEDGKRINYVMTSDDFNDSGDCDKQQRTE